MSTMIYPLIYFVKSGLPCLKYDISTPLRVGGLSAHHVRIHSGTTHEHHIHGGAHSSIYSMYR